MIAVFPQKLVDGHGDVAEEGGHHGRQQNADGSAAIGLQAPGEGIGTIIQLGDGGADGLHIFGAHISAVEILGNGGNGNTSHAGDIADSKIGHKMHLSQPDRRGMGITKLYYNGLVNKKQEGNWKPAGKIR